MPITQADLQGQGGALPPVVRSSISPQEQTAKAEEALAATIKAASEMPESAATKDLLALLGSSQACIDTYRVSIANAMEDVAKLEGQLMAIRQKMLSVRVTEADNDMRMRLQTVLMPTNGVLSRFEQMHQHLAAVEDGLSQLTQQTDVAMDWAKKTGYIASDAS
jgi:hypothetical protein